MTGLGYTGDSSAAGVTLDDAVVLVLLFEFAIVAAFGILYFAMRGA